MIKETTIDTGNATVRIIYTKDETEVVVKQAKKGNKLSYGDPRKEDSHGILCYVPPKFDKDGNIIADDVEHI